MVAVVDGLTLVPQLNVVLEDCGDVPQTLRDSPYRCSGQNNEKNGDLLFHAVPFLFGYVV